MRRVLYFFPPHPMKGSESQATAPESRDDVAAPAERPAEDPAEHARRAETLMQFERFQIRQDALRTCRYGR